MDNQIPGFGIVAVQSVGIQEYKLKKLKQRTGQQSPPGESSPFPSHNDGVPIPEHRQAFRDRRLLHTAVSYQRGSGPAN